MLRLTGEAVQDVTHEYRRRIESLEDALRASGIPVAGPAGEAGGAGGPRAVAVAPAGAAEAAKGGRNAISVTPGLAGEHALGMAGMARRPGGECDASVTCEVGVGSVTCCGV
jgi:hypothetical protein